MKTMIVPVVLATLLLPVAPAVAGENHGHSHSHGEHAHAEIAIPATLAELWQSIQAGHATLQKALESKNVQEAHALEEKLQAYLKALPEKAAALDPAAVQRIDGQAHNLMRAYDAVHRASDTQAWEKAAANMKRAEGGLKLLAAQMPK